MQKIKFKCHKCGRCCDNLFKEEFEITNGLALSPDETSLFPPELISPSKGFGVGRVGPRIIVSYQLNVKTCPHLSENGNCNIYEKRPTVCKVFPLISIGPLGTNLAQPEDCLFVEKLENKIGSLGNFVRLTPKNFKAPEAWNALAKMNARANGSFQANIEDARMLWSFDLKDNQWKIMAAY
jgi:Fe-S-cluster containining protein